MAAEFERTPFDVREGVRSALLTSIERDVELRGSRTARLLLAAGVVGVIGAIGATLLVSGHPFGHHPPWHVAVFSAVWAGLLIVCLAIVFLELRTPSLHLSGAALVGVLGLGLAGLCGALCPDQHFLHWWSATELGGRLAAAGGPALGALCFGLVTTLCFGAFAAFAVLRERARRVERPLVPAAFLVLLLAPGVALQSFGTSIAVFVLWLAGTAAGAYVGVAAGIRMRSRLGARRDPESPGPTQ